MNRWDGIQEFVQVVELGSFTRAAERLGLSNSQVSKRVAHLENRLGVRLLNRTTRRLTLTDEGERYYRSCRDTIDAFERAEGEITRHQDEVRGRLRINITGSFQERFIVPMLADFMRANPGLTVDMDFTDTRVDLVAEGYDLSICPGELEDSSLVARRLADNFHYLVAHPDYLARHGQPSCIDDLQQHNCLVGADPVWPLNDGRGSVDFRPRGNWHSNNGAALLGAVRSGLGIALLPFFAVMEEIERGELVHVLATHNHHIQPVWVLYPHNRHVPARVRLFIEYLFEHLGEIQL